MYCYLVITLDKSPDIMLGGFFYGKKIIVFIDMTLIEVKTKEQKSIVKNIIVNHHSYVASNASVGRRIDWLIYEDSGFPTSV